MSASAPRPRFAGDEGFYAELKRRVQDYFQETGRDPRDDPRMYLKTAMLLAWLAGSYVLLVFVATAWWSALVLSASLAFAMAGVGFAIQHDANHGAYSNHGAVNRVMGMTLDLLGASSYIWHWKHNVFHHTYTNLTGADNDIDVGFFGRLSPGSPRYRIHRFQQFYLWALYGFVFHLHFIEDVKHVAMARISQNRFPRPRGLRLAEMILGKAIFFGWTLVLPMFFHRWWVVLLFFAATLFVLGLILSVVFQLAHCVEEAAFPPTENDQLLDAWAVHQVRTTVDFSRRGRFLCWFLGGLNFQIEHHLFPKICHVHYPRLSRIVETVCGEFGVPYTAHDRLFGALSSHWRWLRRMGRAEPA